MYLLNKFFAVYVLQEFRGRNIGKYMMLDIESWAANKNFKYGFAGAAFNVIKFYEKLNYIEEKEDIVTDGPNYFFMKKELFKR